MALEERIVEWVATRPAWQRLVLRRVAIGEAPSARDYDQLIDDMVAGKSADEVTFGLAQLPHVAAQDLPVRLISIAEPAHVNAIASDQPLTFEPDGLTIIYGDNGSGKSGYARLLKRITRARHREDVLTDVFRDTALEKPAARLSVRVGDKDEVLAWPDDTLPDLQRVLFYDGACGSAYVGTESDFPYRPSALFALDGLIEACVEIRTRIDGRLAENGKSAMAVPVVAPHLKDTEAGRFLGQLSGGSHVVILDKLVKDLDKASDTVDELKDQEAKLRNSDTSQERQRLTRQAEKLDALRTHIETIHARLSASALKAVQQQRDEVEALEKAAGLMARSFDSEPLPGVGSSPWKALWESARRFSEEGSYPKRRFPVTDETSRCVLCQQTLDLEGRGRLSKFEEFVKDDTQVRLNQVRAAYVRESENLSRLTVSSEAVVINQKDLEATHGQLIAEARTLVAKYQTALEQTRAALPGTQALPLVEVQPTEVLEGLANAAKAAREDAQGLSNPELVQQRLAAVTSRRTELELLREIKNSREALIAEIARRREREALEAAKTDAATTGITKKILELSEESITEVVRDTFTRETDRLHLDRVTIARTRAEKGALLHQPKLVGARQTVTLPRVFSEGERTALGLAAFFTEAQLDPSNSAIILDDPVTSLDHIRRGLVATRLATFAETRQVIVFTHDVSLVADLKREANGKGVSVTERSVSRSRANERKPGVCGTSHPWKTKDVPARLDELRTELARIKKESASWDEKAYEDAVAVWAGNLSETWERIFSQEIVGPILAEGGLEVHTKMVKVLARFSETDQKEFDASYGRVSQWAKRHDKSSLVNYVAPDLATLESEVKFVDTWFKRVKAYKS